MKKKLEIYQRQKKGNIRGAKKNSLETKHNYDEIDCEILIQKTMNYKIVKHIGNGTYSKVYKATNINIKNKSKIKSCALKVIRDDKISTAEVICGMICCHPHIIEYKAWFPIYPFYVIEFEYLSGVDLQIYISKNGCLTEPYFLILFKQLVSAIQYLHNMNIAHRDIKMENVVVYGVNFENIKLIDFGLAFFVNSIEIKECPETMKIRNQEDILVDVAVKRKHSFNFSNRLAGTKDYCAPEVLLDALVDPEDLYAADIYSLGVTLQLVLCGEPPPHADDIEELTKLRVNRFDNQYTGQGIIFYKSKDEFSIIRQWFDQYKILQLECISELSEPAQDLILKTIELVPSQRITLKEIKKHKWYRPRSKSCEI